MPWGPICILVWSPAPSTRTESVSPDNIATFAPLRMERSCDAELLKLTLPSPETLIAFSPLASLKAMAPCLPGTPDPGATLREPAVADADDPATTWIAPAAPVRALPVASRKLPVAAAEDAVAMTALPLVLGVALFGRRDSPAAPVSPQHHNTEYFIQAEC